MKVIYLHQYFVTPSMSGGTRSYELARRLASAGHEVHVITSRQDASEHGTSTWYVTNEDGVHVHWTNVAYSNRLGFFQRIRAFYIFAWRATWRAIRLRGDLVFATSTPLTIALPAIFASRYLRVPMVFEVRDLWPEVPIAVGELRSAPLIHAARLLEWLAYRNAAHVIALSPGMAEGVARRGYPTSRIDVIPNACDLDFFQSAGGPLEPGFLPPGEGSLVVYTGTFGKANGVGYLVDVAAAMKQLDPSVRFLLVGDGKEREEIETRAIQNGTLNVNVWLRSPVRKTKMPALLAAATVATSVFADVKELWNTSPNKLFDALAAGKPVMINYGGWQQTMLESSGAGFAVPADDPTQAARKLHAFLSSPDKVAAAGRAALQLAQNQFNRDRLAERFRAILENAVNGRALATGTNQRRRATR